MYVFYNLPSSPNQFNYPNQKNNTVTIKGMGKSINKAVTVCEITKRKVTGLIQTTEISSVEMVDVWEPREGKELDVMEVVRCLPSITMTLSKPST